MTETVAEILHAHRTGRSNPVEAVERSFERIRAHGDDAVFISLRERNKALAEAKALAQEGNRERALYGVPVAVKDNIDVKGMMTTAACPAFAYRAKQDATVIARLRQAGAIIIGKTNLDQFATGLVGVRSPYGIPRNPFNPKIIPGGSSSGSAVAVAAGLVPLALGTDTAGSGRVPAGLNNIIGLKPSLGMVSTSGVLPACRTLDCVSILALNTDDAWNALQAIAGRDSTDPYSRAYWLGSLGAIPPILKVAVPRGADRHFFGDKHAKASFEDAIKRAAKLGAIISEIDFRPLLEVARLLYEGPWVAERYAAVGKFIERHPKQVHPVTRKIIAGARELSATEAFEAFYRLAALREKARELFSAFDVFMVPTVPRAYTIAEIKAEPIRFNSNLGTYTNFANLLDLAGLSVPATITSDGMPYGVTFLAPAGQDALLASIGRGFHADTGLPLGARNITRQPLTAIVPETDTDEIALAIVGAHLSGMPLNGELKMLGARFLQSTATATDYRLYALANTTPAKPGLLRVARDNGAAIAVEIWALPIDAFGRFVAAVPPPLSIGTLKLADGRMVKGFLVEADAITGAKDITDFGGWRAYTAREKVLA